MLFVFRLTAWALLCALAAYLLSWINHPLLGLRLLATAIAVFGLSRLHSDSDLYKKTSGMPEVVFGLAVFGGEDIFAIDGFFCWGAIVLVGGWVIGGHLAQLTANERPRLCTPTAWCAMAGSTFVPLLVPHLHDGNRARLYIALSLCGLLYVIAIASAWRSKGRHGDYGARPKQGNGLLRGSRR